MTLSDASGIHTTKLVTKSDRVEMLHGVTKSLLLTVTPLDYFGFLLIQKTQVSLNLLSVLAFFLRYYSNNL